MTDDRQAVANRIRQHAPSELRERAQWVAWRYIQRDGQWTKAPVDASTGRAASATDPNTWCSFEDALDAFARDDRLAGVGYVFASDDPYCGVDLDDCIDEHGDIAPEAQRIIDSLDSYCEVSPSGRGVKVIVRAAKNTTHCRTKKIEGFGEIEVYDRARFFTITGNKLNGSHNEPQERQQQLDELTAWLWPAKKSKQTESPSQPTPNLRLVGVDDDDALLQRMFSAKNGGAVKRLWDGDVSQHGDDDSSADMALCSHLAYWTGRDPQRMDRLFRNSGLMREKWDERRGDSTYGAQTIARAIEPCNETCKPSESPKKQEQKEESAASVLAAIQKNQADRIAKLVLESDIDLWHAPGADGEGYATSTEGDGARTYPIRSRAFRRVVARMLYESEGKAPSGDSMRDALGVIEARAIYDGDEHEANVRIAQRDWLIYVDLADAERRVIEVSPGGWRVIGSAHAPVRFVQPRGMRALPAPEPGGSLDELRSLLNVGDDSQWALIVGWLIASINPDGPYPILALNGEQGSAKSTTARMLRALLDPNDAPLRAEPREARDLMIAANNARVIALDNISRVQPWLSDGLCRLATGGGFTTRELYSDADETIFDAQRPIVLNGISDYVDRSDLLDRTIGLTLPTIPEGQHRTERDLWREFERLQPRILGALFAAAAWIVAAEPALPIGEGEFLKAYRADRASAREQAIEASPVGPAIMALARRCHPDGWSGTMTDLLAEIEDGDITDARTRRRRDWPGSARGLGAALRRIAPDLREAGVEVRLPSRTRRMVAVEWTDPSGPDGHDDPDGPGGDHARAPSDSGGENGPARRAQRARRAPNPPESLESAIPADSAPDNARADARVGRRNARIGRPDARSNARSKNGPDDPVSPESAHCARRARCAGDFSGSGPASAHARTAEAERLGLDDPEPADRADPPDNGSSAGERVGSDWTGDPDHAIESRARRAMRDAHSEALAAGKGPRDAELTAQRAFRLIYRHAGRTPPEPPAIGDVLDAEPVEDDA